MAGDLAANVTGGLIARSASGQDESCHSLRQYGRSTLRKRTRQPRLGASESGHSTKSLRSSPLRGVVSREAVTS
jgi:hypothetical protein